MGKSEEKEIKLSQKDREIVHYGEAERKSPEALMLELCHILIVEKMDPPKGKRGKDRDLRERINKKKQ